MIDLDKTAARLGSLRGVHSKEARGSLRVALFEDMPALLAVARATKAYFDTIDRLPSAAAERMAALDVLREAVGFKRSCGCASAKECCGWPGCWQFPEEGVPT